MQRKEEPSYHLAGVAGTGMSALAQLLRAQGAAVSGSDRLVDRGLELEAMDRLRAAGVRLFPQDGSGMAGGACLVVSSAIEEDNPDLLAARRLGARVAHRAEVLAERAPASGLAVVGGTSGKTTVTAMAGWMLAAAGMDPTVVNGGALRDWEGPASVGSVRRGEGPWVLEGDESDRSILRFRPDWAVLTNISPDHFNLPTTVRLFRDVAARVRRSLVCPMALAEQLGRIKGGGVLETYDPGACRLTPCPGGWSFHYEGVRFRVPLPGRHNAENALAAAALCRTMGAALETLPAALESFRGVRRRMELVGRGAGARVFDDIAHNPAKIRAAWLAAAEGGGRVLGVWRPHGFGPLAAMAGDLESMFAETLRPADLLLVLPVYYAGGTARKALTARDFTARLRAAHLPVGEASDPAAARRLLAAAARPGDAILVMGARDPGLPELARGISGDLQAR